MLNVLKEFYRDLDEIMLKSMHRRIILYGIDSYTGRFIKWYGKYYHNLTIDYLISTDMSRQQSYETEIYRPRLFEFDYKDVNNCIVWLAVPLEEVMKDSNAITFQDDGREYFDFYEKIYKGDYYVKDNDIEQSIYRKKKVGRRDIQFLEWLEWKYGCNFISRVNKEDMRDIGEHGNGYGVTTQKDIFPVLDACHCKPKQDDAIFDFGCGKGGALISFLDYGFDMVGGVEFEKELYEIMIDNFNKLKIPSQCVKTYCSDASKLDEELDDFNWFYFYEPFDRIIFQKCANSIVKSYYRKKRKMHIILVPAANYDIISESDVFNLIMQLSIDRRNRVVDIFESIE